LNIAPPLWISTHLSIRKEADSNDGPIVGSSLFFLKTLVDCQKAPLLELDDLQRLALPAHQSKVLRRMMQHAQKRYLVHAVEIEKIPACSRSASCALPVPVDQ
jgi:hypothetical protein